MLFIHLIFFLNEHPNSDGRTVTLAHSGCLNAHPSLPMSMLAKYLVIVFRGSCAALVSPEIVLRPRETESKLDYRGGLVDLFGARWVPYSFDLGRIKMKSQRKPTWIGGRSRTCYSDMTSNLRYSFPPKTKQGFTIPQDKLRKPKRKIFLKPFTLAVYGYCSGGPPVCKSITKHQNVEQPVQCEPT